MTAITYRLKQNPGCVVQEYVAWQAGVDNTPLREALSAVDTTRFDYHTVGRPGCYSYDSATLWVTDMSGETHRVLPGWYLVQRLGDYLHLRVVSPESFADLFEEVVFVG